MPCAGAEAFYEWRLVPAYVAQEKPCSIWCILTKHRPMHISLPTRLAGHQIIHVLLVHLTAMHTPVAGRLSIRVAFTRAASDPRELAQACVQGQVRSYPRQRFQPSGRFSHDRDAQSDVVRTTAVTSLSGEQNPAVAFTPPTLLHPQSGVNAWHSFPLLRNEVRLEIVEARIAPGSEVGQEAQVICDSANQRSCAQHRLEEVSASRIVGGGSAGETLSDSRLKEFGAAWCAQGRQLAIIESSLVSTGCNNSNRVGLHFAAQRCPDGGPGVVERRHGTQAFGLRSSLQTFHRFQPVWLQHCEPLLRDNEIFGRENLILSKPGLEAQPHTAASEVRLWKWYVETHLNGFCALPELRCENATGAAAAGVTGLPHKLQMGQGTEGVPVVDADLHGGVGAPCRAADTDESEVNWLLRSFGLQVGRMWSPVRKEEAVDNEVGIARA
mmetsp:Transcript_24548/g.64539  ORF Transcript_24548/g.64539 Transcript_24548/m.64539 type:complete len:440 (-) Transcript_24548:939-2258(-)